jgi:hypothetical protein
LQSSGKLHTLAQPREACSSTTRGQMKSCKVNGSNQPNLIRNCGKKVMLPRK